MTLSREDLSARIEKVQASNLFRPEWLDDPFVQTVSGLFASGSFKFVGGAVRDSLLGEAVFDLDAATSLPPQEVTRLLEAANIRAVPTGLAHGTVTAVLAGRHMEITTLREDIETDGRRAKVVFTDNWREDALRRDFTVNAIYLSPNGAVFDPLNGLEDLKKKHVSFIGDAQERLGEDALRVLRYFRFLAKFLDRMPAASLRVTLTEAASLLDNVSAERVKEELFKWLILPGAALSVQTAAECGIFRSKSCVPQLDQFARAQDFWGALSDRPSSIEAFFALFFRPGFDARQQATEMKLARREKAFLVDSQSALQGLAEQGLTAAALRAGFYRWGARPVRAALAGVSSAKVNEPAGGVQGIAEMYKRVSDSWSRPVFPLKAAELKALGHESGPEMGRLLKSAEDQWIKSDFSLTKEELLGRVK